MAAASATDACVRASSAPACPCLHAPCPTLPCLAPPATLAPTGIWRRRDAGLARPHRDHPGSHQRRFLGAFRALPGRRAVPPLTCRPPAALLCRLAALQTALPPLAPRQLQAVLKELGLTAQQARPRTVLPLHAPCALPAARCAAGRCRRPTPVGTLPRSLLPPRHALPHLCAPALPTGAGAREPGAHPGGELSCTHSPSSPSFLRL